MSITRRYAAFSGAGVNGAAHVGEIKQLQKEVGTLKPFVGVAGTSAGAITGLLFALGLTAEKIEELFMEIDFQKLDDRKNILREVVDIFEQDSLAIGAELRKMVTTLMQKACGNIHLTYGDLAKKGYKDLHVVTTRIGKRFGEGTADAKTFNAETTPHTQILPTIIASASIEGFFPPILMKEVKPGQFEEITNPDPNDPDVLMYADGGFMQNLPVRAFDKKKYLSTFKPGDTDGEEECFNPETLGFMICIPAETLRQTKMTALPRHNPVAYVRALANGAVFGTQEHNFWYSSDSRRTVLSSNNGISSRDFSITPSQVKMDVNSGITATADFFHPEEKEHKTNAAQAYAKGGRQMPSPIHTKKPLAVPLLSANDKNNSDDENNDKGWKCCTIM